MNNLYAKVVFFVKDAERSLEFYTQTLGFSVDWVHRESGRPFVTQVSLMGFELILNQTELETELRAGQGRVFLGLDAEQSGAFRRHLDEKSIQTAVVHWGAPTLVFRDLDGNEFFVWVSDEARTALETK
jgi:catechol 2,3-dioxygenase-like lactoylglutathione lyase family enzyme